MRHRIATSLIAVAILLAAGPGPLLAQASDNPPGLKPLPPATLKLDERAPPKTPLTPPPTGPVKAPATVTVQVPANATVWIGDQMMTLTGTARTFKSPPLDPAKAFVYKVKVSWPNAPGQKEQVSEQEITVRANQTSIIDFTPLARGPIVVTQPLTPTARVPRTGVIQPTSGQRK